MMRGRYYRSTAGLSTSSGPVYKIEVQQAKAASFSRCHEEVEGSYITRRARLDHSNISNELEQRDVCEAALEREGFLVIREENAS